MTRKDYEKIAAVIKRQVSTYTDSTDPMTIIESLADDISIILAADNPRFDRKKFLAACGIEEV